MSKIGCAIALIVIMCACGRADEEALTSPEPRASSTNTVEPKLNGSPTRRPGSGNASAATATPASAKPDAPVNPGDAAAIYVRGDVPALVVEVDAVEGGPRSSSSLDLLRQRLASVVDKPRGITFRPTGRLPSHPGRWSFDQLRAAERTHRDTHTSTQVASLYLMFVDGTPPEEGAVGIAFSASAVAIFDDQIEEASTLLVSAAAIERAVTVHEVGHVLSLVGLGYTSPRNHEDAQHPGHSDNPASVMYWAVDNVGVATLLGGRTEPPNDFDADDRADLADIRAGRLP